jgi:hypothetical protein
MLRKFVPALLAAAMIGLPLSTGVTLPAFAQSTNAEPIRVRGAIVSFSGQTLTVETREGEIVDIALLEGWMVSSVARAAVSDIQPGDFVGVASIPEEGGGDGALAVMIFPSGLPGPAEGSFEYDLRPNSAMTNATVADAVTGVNSRTVTVSYNGEEKKFEIPEGTPVVTYAPATQADLKPKAIVFILAEKGTDGAISARHVVVGTNGVVPPM